MDFSLGRRLNSATWAVLLGFFYIISNLQLVSCQGQEEIKIKFVTNSFFHLPQIPEEYYSVVPQTILSIPSSLGTNNSPQQSPADHRFAQKQSSDHFVTLSSEAEHHVKRYNNIKGKNIFTPAYISSQVLDSNEEVSSYSNELSILNEKLREQFNQKVQDHNQNPTVDEKPKEEQATKKIESLEAEREGDVIQEKSSELYSEFKNLEVIKEKNLRDETPKEDEEKYQNLQKLIGYIVIGLVLSFAILKRATKTQPALPAQNFERRQLRLRDATEDQDDQDASSSESD